jgi:hypothetical protein
MALNWPLTSTPPSLARSRALTRPFGLGRNVVSMAPVALS